MSYGSIIGKAIIGNETAESATQAAALLYAVQRKMICSCGSILDVRRSVLVESTTGTAAVVCGFCFDKHRKAEPELYASFTDIGGSFTDGRVLHARKLV